MKFGASLAALVVASAAAVGQPAATLEGITFASSPGKVLAPIREIGDAFGIPVAYNKGRITFGDSKLNEDGPSLPDGTRLIPLRTLTNWGFEVSWDAEQGHAAVNRGGKSVNVLLGAKQVRVDKRGQVLRAMQGKRVLMETPISSGREGYRTPNGKFTAGPYKALMHRSSLYDDAPMPYSVQVVGNIFIHGYAAVPETPASHGCIRVSTDGSNPAKFFYQWVDIGTPVQITGSWSR